MNFPLPGKAGSGDGPQRQGTPISRVDQQPVFVEVYGPDGAQGRQGFYGLQGPLGSVGGRGDEGLVGYQGPQGWQGWQGFQAEGTQGIDGLVGYSGLAGNQGSQGSQVVGPPNSGTENGPQGNQGDTNGPQGNQGAQGSQGAQGGQGAQSNIGFQGYQGVQGFMSPGTTGRPGKYGAQGSQGWQGLTGVQGNQGWQGAQAPSPGTIGVQGHQWITGRQGYLWVLGSQGWQGQQGQFIAPSEQALYVEDFDGSGPDPTIRKGTTGSGGGGFTLVNDAIGVVKITTPSSASGTAWIALGQVADLPGQQGLANYATFTAYVAIYGTSMSGQEVLIGLTQYEDDPESGGCFFKSDNINDGMWSYVNTDSDGTTSVVGSDYPKFTDGATYTFQKLEIVRSATDVKFYIDDALKATNTTNISWNNLIPIIYIYTSSGNRSIFCDAIQFKVTR